jgi:hypothetical protein
MGDAGRFRLPGRRRTNRVRVGRFVRRLSRGAVEGDCLSEPRSA